MSVSLLIISHGDVGKALVKAVIDTFGELPLLTKTFRIDKNDDPNLKVKQIETIVSTLDQGDGILILTDLYGSTPSNIAEMLHQKCLSRMIAGVNLPMLIRIMNYPDLTLDDLVEKALSGGQDGINAIKP